MTDAGLLSSCSHEVWSKLKKGMEYMDASPESEPVWRMSDARFTEVFQYQGSDNHVPLYYASDKGERQMRTLRVRNGLGSRATLWSLILARYRSMSAKTEAVKSVCGDIYCFNPWCGSSYSGQLSKRKREDMMKERRHSKMLKGEDSFYSSPATPMTPVAGQESDGYSSSSSFLCESHTVSPKLMEFTDCESSEEFSEPVPVVKEEPALPRFHPSFYHKGSLLLRKLTENDPLFHELLEET